MRELEQLLNLGLREGFAGQTERETAQRGPFQLEASQFTSPTGGVYRDEWIGEVTGGGQEIAQIGDNTVTRLYAGGTLADDQLKELGLTKKDVIDYLKSKIAELGDETRLGEDCRPDADGDWLYVYAAGDPDYEGIPVSLGVEEIIFKETTVFVHIFLRTSVE